MSQMTISAGIIDIRPLVSLTSEISLEDAFLRWGASGREYNRLMQPIVNTIPVAQGFYVWGYFDSIGKWRTIYVGKATLGKIASLRYRISDELREEKAFAWACRYPDEAVRNAFVQVWKNSRELRHVNRALRKKGSEHIAWVACPALAIELVRPMEAALIQRLAPSVNQQRPAQAGGVDKYVVEPILAELERVTRYDTCLR